MIRLKNVIFIVFQLPVFLVFAANPPVVLGQVPLAQNINTIGFMPQNTNSVPEVFISRDQYLISFNQSTRLLNWAAWKVDLSNLGHAGRTNKFTFDTDLETYLSKFNQHAVTNTDYTNSCFDRGHQVPSADRDDTVDNNRMTFLMSNMVPQTAYLNRVVWEHLEQYARNLVQKDGKTVYIIAGPIFDEDFGKIGKNNDIPVPSKDFKVVVVLEKGQTLADISSTTEIIAVVMPNLLKSGNKPLDNRTELCAGSVDPLADPSERAKTDTSDWMQYKTTVSQVNQLSGFQVLPSALVH